MAQTASPQASQQPPPPPSQFPTAQIAAASSTIAVASVLATAISPSLAYAELAPLVKAKSAISQRALHLVLDVAEKNPLPPVEGLGYAQRYVVQLNVLRRAGYVQAALKRVRNELLAGTSVPQVFQTENRYFAQHIQAMHQRMLAAGKIDALQWRYGNTLGWYAVHDKKTTKECLWAHGKNFSAMFPPAIGWPGLTHTNCRCYPGRPWRRGAMMT